MKKRAVLAMTLMIHAAPFACGGKKDRKADEALPNAPVVPVGPSVPSTPAEPSESSGPESVPKSFRERLVGEWFGCQEGQGSSRSHRFIFSADSLQLVTTDFQNDNCNTVSGGDFAPETYKVRYSLGGKQEPHESYEFEYALIDNAGYPSSTVYTSIKLEGDTLLMSRGALNLDAEYGNGRAPETRFLFPEDPANARSRVLKKVP